MRAWTVTCGKRGIGKTTLVTSLMVIAETCGERVLLLDLDPQGSSLVWSQMRGTRNAPTGSLRV